MFCDVLNHSFGWILNLYDSTHQMKQSLANLSNGNPLHFRGLRTEVTNFSYRKLYGAYIVVESTVNNCHYESVATEIQMPLYREIHGPCFYVRFVRQIMDSNESTFALFVYSANTCIFY